MTEKHKIMNDKELKAQRALGTVKTYACHMCGTQKPICDLHEVLFGHNDFVYVQVCKGGCR